MGMREGDEGGLGGGCSCGWLGGFFFDEFLL